MAHEKNKKPVSNLHSIQTYVHCRQCIEETPPGISHRDWARFEIGFTDVGLQVWCTRHGANVMHVDFEGQRHPANTTAGLKEKPS